MGAGFHVHLFRLLFQLSYLFYPKQIPCFLFVVLFKFKENTSLLPIKTILMMALNYCV